MTPPLLYLVRHGETDWNAERRFQGQADIPVNAKGHIQAVRNGRRLAELEAEVERLDFVASPLSRTRETMRLLRSALGLDPDAFRTDARLMELHFGDWQGSTLAELEARTPGSTAAREHDKWNFLPPGADAESYEMLSRRVDCWLSEQTRAAVCVTHGGVIRSIFRLRGGASTEQAAAITVPQDKLLVVRGNELEWL
jgi:probable phosphoglycerate mutase